MSSKSSARVIWRVLVLIMLMLTGCRGRLGKTIANEPTAAAHVNTRARLPAAASVPLPTGRFAAEAETGYLVLWIRQDGAYRVTLDGTMLDSGRFLAGTADQVSAQSDECTRWGHKPAAYVWQFAQGKLTFHPLASDSCTHRRTMLGYSYDLRMMFVVIPSCSCVKIRC